MADIRHLSERKLDTNRPFVNVLKKFDLNTWKKSLRNGKCCSYYDPQVKSTVHALESSTPSNFKFDKSNNNDINSSNNNYNNIIHNNYIQLPKFNHNDLKLKGRYFYLNLLSSPESNFVVCLNCKLSDHKILYHNSKHSNSSSVGISFSTSFVDFKKTRVGCQIPVVCNSALKRKVIERLENKYGGLFVLVEDKIAWTTLCIDVEYLCDVVFQKKYTHIKGLKIQGDVVIKNMFVSDYLFVPGHLLKEVMTPLCYLLPDEMTFPVDEGHEWKELFAFICFPQNICMEPDCVHGSHIIKSTHQVPNSSSQKVIHKDTMLKSKSSSLPFDDDDEDNDEENIKDDYDNDDDCDDDNDDDDDREFQENQRQDNAVLQLEHVVGFGGVNTKHAVMDRSASWIIYPCNALLVLQSVNTGVQRFMIGHTNEITCLSVDRDFKLLTSSDTSGLLRLWWIEGLECRGVLHTGGLNVYCLSISRSGQKLYCLGRDSLFKNVIVIWDISDNAGEGDFKVICKGHTDVQMVKMMMMMSTSGDFDDDRMISCGHGNIRLWRIKSGQLKSTPINLSGHHLESFVDLVFESEAVPSEFTERTRDDSYRRAYACTKSCMIFEIDCVDIFVIRVFDFKNIPPINKNPFTPSSLLVTQNYILLGGKCGSLRIWTRDGKVDLFQLALSGVIEVVKSNNDCSKILIGRSDGSLGILDLKKRMLMPIQSPLGKKIMKCSMDVRRINMCTISIDGSVRLWTLFNMSQPKSILPPTADVPTISAFHPKHDALFLGFSSGDIKVYGEQRLDYLVAVLKLHNSSVTAISFNNGGSHMYSCSNVSRKLVMHTINFITDDGDDDGGGGGPNGENSGDVNGKDIDNKNDVGRKLQIICSHVRSLHDVMVTASSSSCLSFSSDGSLIAYVGSSHLFVSVRDSLTLSEVKRIDMCKVTKSYDWRTTSTCSHVTFCTGSNTCLLVQSGDGSIYTYDYMKDEVLRQLENPSPSDVVTVISTFDGYPDVVVVSCDRLIKVYLDRGSSQFQLFIGHSDPILQMTFDPLRSTLVTIGDALFLWKFKHESNCLHSNGHGIQSLRTCTSGDQPLNSPIKRGTPNNKPITKETSSDEDDDNSNESIRSLPVIRRIINYDSTMDFRNGFKEIIPKQISDFPRIKRHYARIKI